MLGGTNNAIVPYNNDLWLKAKNSHTNIWLLFIAFLAILKFDQVILETCDVK